MMATHGSLSLGFKYLLWATIASALLLVPFTSVALLRAYHAILTDAPLIKKQIAEIAKKFDANYHADRCYQVLTIRNYREDQRQWEVPCACTGNFAVLAEAEYAAALQQHKFSISETSTEYLFYDFDLIAQLNNRPEAVQAALKDKYRRIIREQCWRPHGLERFWTDTYTRPSPIQREPLLPPGFTTIG